MNQKLATHGHTVRNFSVLLSPTPRGARLARLFATEQLRTWGLPLDPARLVVAELANNAVTHGRVPGRNFQLLLYVVGGTLRIEVTDTRGDRLPDLHAPEPDAETGRGLALVTALADRWGVIPGPPPRKTVWAELTLPARPSPEHNSPRSGRTCAPQALPTGEKAPHQAPPLPPAGQTHPRE
ncbi:ATP-binding protein [Streptomyces sp. DSM 41972]|uniref:ATP-binding protein n=1 Tax=Streptomyces althioticus subsp. attaecolombicae TaxID=3075534 RepID=A0ABU3HVX3_9ACTN|nr:ATP-binding protein [Streptomyces sp. DSM 41972]SCD37297.1 Anti-sigma regulatory factor (Ser/Thr protein kinase) [Streptomyces sp. di50b]SCE46334.1 Anti-sigma regulatory factor (Ser/Thr protein kinase) [Streptomyces sp. di188]